MRHSIAKAVPFHRFLSPLITLVLATLALAPMATAQSSSNRVEGVANFGQVTERYFRGGQVTPSGVDKLAEMGVRTIIDLRDKPSEGEPEACKRNGINYHKFPMDGSLTPDDKSVNEILSIIQNAKEPVYVHCSAGKHRAGAIAALYRIRVQGWSKEQAWAEQQSYGFGPAEEHPALYAYVYGEALNKGPVSIAQMTAANTREGQASKSWKQSDGEKDRSSKKSDKLEKLKKDDDDDDDDDDEKAKNKIAKNSKSQVQARSESRSVARGIESGVSRNSKSEPKIETRSPIIINYLTANTGYITMADAIKRAQVEGASGETLKVDLEWDDARSTATWDVTFSSGAEFEVDAISGKFLGTKAKAPAKIATLTPLSLNGTGLIEFMEIIRIAETEHKQNVKEMELKRIKGRSETVFEVLLVDGATLFYDAETGKPLTTQ